MAVKVTQVDAGCLWLAGMPCVSFVESENDMALFSSGMKMLVLQSVKRMVCSGA